MASTTAEIVSQLMTRLRERPLRTPPSEGARRVSSRGKTQLTERQARLAQVKAQQRRADRNRTLIISSVVGVVILGLVGTTIAVVNGENAKNAAIKAAAAKPIDGVKKFTGLTRNHVAGPVTYAQDPPVGGDHAADLQNCGFYPDKVADVNAVHSLEHGAVWITYAPDLPADQVGTLRTFTGKYTYLLVSPRPGLTSPVVASAWGVQLQLKSADDSRLPVFLKAYVQGPQTLEAGAACSGGVGTPTK